ncbi:hypothetical protein CC86DRAFT_389684 [Ophiobolus disseminans]|uniref:BTB domain-containing protein n=1 Tax=Ophiobolus disseminans TaxID=1469910 RepID=A0A6A7AL24_9PLEO|nr:hypothetical protein CC86DRAFT_389684 [Ophiobolus disseminans]
MAPTTHILDPRSDTMLVLRNPSVSFAHWVPPARIEQKTAKYAIMGVEDTPSSAHKDKSKKKSKILKIKRSVLPPSPEPPFFDDPERSSYLSPEPTFPIDPAQDDEDTNVYFNSESGRSEDDGRYHVEAEDQDPEAFLIVLNALHHRSKQIPRVVSLEMLAKIAVLVDYYECDEAIEVWTAMWISNLIPRDPIPSTYSRTLILTEAIQTLELPIPSRVSGEIDSMRYRAIKSVVEGVHSLLGKYRDSDYVCAADSSQSFECGSFLLGALTKQLDAHSLLSPRPKVPFTGLSFESMCGEVEIMKSPEWAIPNHDYHHRYERQHGCNLNGEVKAVVANAKASINGLGLDMFKNDSSIGT